MLRMTSAEADGREGQICPGSMNPQGSGGNGLNKSVLSVGQVDFAGI